MTYFFLHALKSALGNEVTGRTDQQPMSSADGCVIVPFSVIEFIVPQFSLFLLLGGGFLQTVCFSISAM